jgi:hypothetical protein
MADGAAGQAANRNLSLRTDEAFQWYSSLSPDARAAQAARAGGANFQTAWLAWRNGIARAQAGRAQADAAGALAAAAEVAAAPPPRAAAAGGAAAAPAPVTWWSWFRNPSALVGVAMAAASRPPAFNLNEFIRQYKTSSYSYPRLQWSLIALRDPEAYGLTSSQAEALTTATMARLEAGKKANRQYRALLSRLLVYKDTFSASARARSVGMLLHQTNALLEDLLLFTVYDLEKEEVARSLDEIRTAAGIEPLEAGGSQNVVEGAMYNTEVQRFPPAVADELNAILRMNPTKATAYLLEPGQGARESAIMPHIVGALDVDINTGTIADFQARVVNGAKALARQIERNRAAAAAAAAASFADPVVARAVGEAAGVVVPPGLPAPAAAAAVADAAAAEARAAAAAGNLPPAEGGVGLLLELAEREAAVDRVEGDDEEELDEDGAAYNYSPGGGASGGRNSGYNDRNRGRGGGGYGGGVGGRLTISRNYLERASGWEEEGRFTRDGRSFYLNKENGTITTSARGKGKDVTDNFILRFNTRGELVGIESKHADGRDREGRGDAGGGRYGGYGGARKGSRSAHRRTRRRHHKTRRHNKKGRKGTRIARRRSTRRFH